MLDIKTIAGSIHNCLRQTNLPLPNKYTGKVRDMYVLDDVSILISTDRQSAFDRVLGAIPFKGQVLAKSSMWWFERTQYIINNHVLASPDPNVIIAKKCRVLPIEFVVRGYITGTTATSLWTQYTKGVRTYCGISFPEGLQKNQKLSANILTPTTKDSKHDRPISSVDIVAESWMKQYEWDYTSQKALDLFAFGQQEAEKRGLILVDTKYEFGIDESTGEILLIDEIHTPDSSRFWIQDTYQDRINKGLEPDNLDKEFFRIWFADNCDPYNDSHIPAAPQDLIIELSRRYIQQYEMITGENFIPSKIDEDIHERIKQNVLRYFYKN